MSDDTTQDLPPAYFLRLSLENVRCFGPEQTLDLSDDEDRPAQWTVLLGDNGTGKTTVLQALAGMHTVDAYQMEDELKVEPILTFGPRVYSEWLGDAHRKSGFLHVDVEVLFSERLDTGARRKTKFDFGTSKATYLPGVADITCIGYGASRKMSREGLEEMDEIGVRSLFSAETELPNAHEWLLQTDYAAKSGKPAARKRLNQIKQILADPDSGILPDVDDIRFAEQEGDYSPPRVEFHTPYGWVTIDQLSLGYRTMIAWVVDLARRLFKRYPEMENPLEGPAVCLVDEIDLHLHPKWQRKIIGFLSDRFPNTQFIVTAHSPLVVQAAQDANVALLKRVENPDGDDYVEIHNDMKPLRNLRVDQILTSDLYGLQSARPPEVETLMEERKELLSQSELSEEEKERLEELEEKIGDLPAGETEEEREAMAFMRDLSERLESDS